MNRIIYNRYDIRIEGRVSMYEHHGLKSIRRIIIMDNKTLDKITSDAKLEITHKIDEFISELQDDYSEALWFFRNYPFFFLYYRIYSIINVSKYIRRFSDAQFK